MTAERCKHCGMCQDGCREALEVRLTTATDLLAELVAYVDQAEELDAAWEATGTTHRTVRGMGVALAEVIENAIKDRNELRERVFEMEGREARLKDALARWSRGEVVADKLGEPVKLNGAPEIKTEGAEAEVTLRMTLSQAAKLGIFTWLQEKGYGPR